MKYKHVSLLATAYNDIINSLKDESVENTITAFNEVANKVSNNIKGLIYEDQEKRDKEDHITAEFLVKQAKNGS